MDSRATGISCYYSLILARHSMNSSTTRSGSPALRWLAHSHSLGHGLQWQQL